MHKKSFLILFLIQIAFFNGTALANTLINIPLQKDVEPPALLSNTGIFQGNIVNLEPNAELLAYDINQALWVDYAKKQRYLYLPPNEKIIFSKDQAWAFPVGTILVKHFRMETSFQIYQNIETRILVRKEGQETQNWVGYTYRWTGEDAVLVDGRASPEVLLTVDVTADGGARVQNFKIPNRRMCLQCHNSSVGFVRSVNTEQINREYSGTNQLVNWNQHSIFDKDIGTIDNFIKFSDLKDLAASPEEKVKTYLDVNCSHCHNPDPAAMCSFTGLDFRYGHFNIEDLVSSGHLVKGSKADSMIYQRMSSEVVGIRMPFIGSKLKDTLALDTIGTWIDSLPK